MSSITDQNYGIESSTAIKAPVRCATTANITLSGFQVTDGVTLASGDENLRVLVKDQTDTTENGIYDANTNAWTRAADFDGNRDVRKGTLIPVNEGTVNADVVYSVTSADDIVIGTSNITFQQSALTSAGAAATAQAAAEAAQALAETAQTAAELAETNAETAETNAETAGTNAEAAQALAETAQSLAEAAAEAATTGVGNFNFGVFANSPADMLFNVGAGSISLYGTTTAYAAQDDVATLVAPVTNPRIDRVVVDLFTGVASVVAGTEAASPVAPDVPPGKVAAAQIALATSMTDNHG